GSRAEAVQGNGRASAEERVGEGREHLRAVDLDQLAPNLAARGAAVSEADQSHLTRSKGQPVDHLQAEHLHEGLRIAAEPDVLGWVHYAAEKRHHEVASRLHVWSQGGGGLVAGRVEA